MQLRDISSKQRLLLILYLCDVTTLTRSTVQLAKLLPSLDDFDACSIPRYLRVALPQLGVPLLLPNSPQDTLRSVIPLQPLQCMQGSKFSETPVSVSDMEWIGKYVCCYDIEVDALYLE